ncbi:phosphoenolpyruvate synthase [Tessaracoccus lubricantis]|uniref:Phosphoenolpyruvate synthase n=1 Tax=Tessaracoccus lubricantis TaxID=545543 RepID=A0ABP9FDY9_9ACTN
MEGSLGVGGKGANLIRLRDAAFPVPPFVVLEAREYREFVAAHGLELVIADALVRPPAEASDEIRQAFRQPFPEAQRRRILQAADVVARGPVAVRSSATAEDLPEASFAGQHDSFLDVVGPEALLEAVVECFSSLWTERAISYRTHNGIDHGEVTIAVIVQEMVPAEAAGVLFTADPLTGRRGRVVVEAVHGSAEELVLGTVTPERYEVDDGVLLPSPEPTAEPTLTAYQVVTLASLGKRIEHEFGAPQDIEWTLAGGSFQVVQSRPITTLYPLPEPSPPDALWFSVGAFQGVLNPLTPLGQDVLQVMAAGIPTLVGGHVDYRANPYLRPAGERLWIRLDDVLRTRAGIVIGKMLQMIDPNASATVAALAGEYMPSTRASIRAVRRLLPFIAKVVPGVLRGFRRPESARARVEEPGQRLVDGVAASLEAASGTPARRLAARVEAVREFGRVAFPTMLPVFGPIMVPSVAATIRLRALAAHSGLSDAQSLVLEIMGSLTGNVTARMDRELWDAARAIRDDGESRQSFEGRTAVELAEAYLAGELPAVAQKAVARFLRDYGTRGPAEIDIGAARWAEAPEGVLRTMQGFLSVPEEQSPARLHEAGRLRAASALRRLEDAVGGWRSRQVRFLASRLRGLFGARETPKFAMARCLGLLRRALLDSGEDLVAAGRIERSDDVFFLTLDELGAAFDDTTLRDVVAGRRTNRAREQRRTRVPVVMTGDGRTFYEAPGGGDGELSGSGVSPGTVEGVARVVEDPASSQLQPGEILVCRGTDPAWTPLFLVAGGLVTEVGGLMTHGAVVAREYGLPAVVGVAHATSILTTGSRIRLDGSTGAITMVE